MKVYGITEYWVDGELDCIYDGFGEEDSDGVIHWGEGYEPPKDDDFYFTTIVRYGK